MEFMCGCASVSQSPSPTCSSRILSRTSIGSAVIAMCHHAFNGHGDTGGGGSMRVHAVLISVHKPFWTLNVLFCMTFLRRAAPQTAYSRLPAVTLPRIRMSVAHGDGRKGIIISENVGQCKDVRSIRHISTVTEQDKGAETVLAVRMVRLWM
jgi:hypothetical protein